MSEKDIKTKPKTTTKAVQNAPKVADRFAKEAVKDIKTVSKDVFIKNIVDKRLDTRQSEQPQRAEVEATEQVENTYYSTVDTVYQKGKLQLRSRSERQSSKPLKIGYGKTQIGVMSFAKSTMFALTLSDLVNMTESISPLTALTPK